LYRVSSAARGFPCPSGEIKLGADKRYAFSNMSPSGNSKSVLGARLPADQRYTAPRRQRPSPIPLPFSICGQGSVPVLGAHERSSRSPCWRAPSPGSCNACPTACGRCACMLHRHDAPPSHTRASDSIGRCDYVRGRMRGDANRSCTRVCV